MRTLFILIIIGVFAYGGYTIVQKDKILGPRVDEISWAVKEKLGLATPMITQSHCAIRFINPQAGDTITSPFTLDVVVDNSQENCSWTVFEGQAGLVEIQNTSGQVLYKAPLIAQAEWMTSLPVSYQAELNYSDYTGPLKIMITEENPSGEGIPDRAFIIVTAH